jgi:acyl phosphate:glycerol-3-phosphate acyltransferase
LLTWALAPISYVLGMFPSAVIVARADGVDITAQGSGNPGASNVTRVLGWKRGVLVFVLDAAKGAIAAALGLVVVGRPAGYICAAAAALGHMFPVVRWFGTKRFQGGKGVATFGGAMFVLQPIVTPILAVVWFATLKLTRRASIATFVMILLLPVGAALVGSPAWEIVAILGLGALVLLKHTDNIKRLVRREELPLDKNP